MCRFVFSFVLITSTLTDFTDYNLNHSLMFGLLLLEHTVNIVVQLRSIFCMYFYLLASLNKLMIIIHYDEMT